MAWRVTPFESAANGITARESRLGLCHHWLDQLRRNQSKVCERSHRATLAAALARPDKRASSLSDGSISAGRMACH
ncbi:hypothetical protein MRX96_014636 [Rhipicephalus microplus]